MPADGPTGGSAVNSASTGTRSSGTWNLPRMGRMGRTGQTKTGQTRPPGPGRRVGVNRFRRLSNRSSTSDSAPSASGRISRPITASTAVTTASSASSGVSADATSCRSGGWSAPGVEAQIDFGTGTPVVIPDNQPHPSVDRSRNTPGSLHVSASSSGEAQQVLAKH